MTIERAVSLAIRKPWGSADLRPWSGVQHDGELVGELWFQRRGSTAQAPGLLLKLLFANEPLSIQVHPDDALARALGAESGKTEAWYIISAKPGAQVALGLKQQLTTSQLRVSIADGSIVELVRWREVAKGDVLFVPAGTIHAIGAGLVIAEIQQRSDTTFRLYDFGRDRGLDIDRGVAAAIARPAEEQSAPRSLTSIRTQLVTCPQFILEAFDLPAGASLELRAERETWLLILDGHGQVNAMKFNAGEAAFVEADILHVTAGASGVRGLLAYAGSDLYVDAPPRHPGLAPKHQEPLSDPHLVRLPISEHIRDQLVETLA